MESKQRSLNSLQYFHELWQIDPSFFIKETEFPSEHPVEKSWDLQSKSLGLSNDLDLQVV